MIGCFTISIEYLRFTEMNTMPEATHLPKHSRFEISSEAGTAHLDYLIDGSNMTIHHTFVPPAFRGKGYAALLANAAFEYAKQSKLTIIPECSYIESYLKRRTK